MAKLKLLQSAALLTLCFSAGAASAVEPGGASVAAAGSASATAGAAASTAASASSVDTLAANQLATQFEAFAGSSANAQNLVNGLRSGTPITLTGSGQAAGGVTIVPSTGVMGFGEIKRALSLAQAQLAAQGVTSPTPQQIQVALMGGATTSAGTTTRIPGVLQLRSQGMGWGEIAQTLNLGTSGNARVQQGGALPGTRQRAGASIETEGATTASGIRAGVGAGANIGLDHGLGAGGMVGGAAGVGGLGIGAGGRLGGALGR